MSDQLDSANLALPQMRRGWRIAAMPKILFICMNMHQPMKSGKIERFGQKWEAIRKVRSEITTALEAARNEGLIGGSLSADIRVHVSAETRALLEGLDLASLCITSSAELVTGSVTETRIEVARATGGKCARC